MLTLKIFELGHVNDGHGEGGDVDSDSEVDDLFGDAYFLYSL